ncbi:MAG: MBL fold metallo-hydrolase [Deltaproteobacteria bacterium]|nr:MBL fold metallo-hydrolase [Deltaproteobacteria bacterium]
MKQILQTTIFLFVASLLIFASYLPAQDLGPHFKKIKEGIFVHAANPLISNIGIILTQEGVVLIDSGLNPPDSHAVMKAVKQLTSQPIRLLINTEPHNDHTTGHFVFSPPAIIIGAQGATESMKKIYDLKRVEQLSAKFPEASQGYRLITPHVEYKDKMTLRLGERTFELMHLKDVHSESDTAIWLPKERVLFSAAAAIVKSYNNLRPFVSIPAILSALKMMKSLNPEVVVPGHGPPGTTKIFDDTERFYTLLLERVERMVREGKSLDQIKQELKMPEYDDWGRKERFPNNIEAAYRAVKGN